MISRRKGFSLLEVCIGVGVLGAALAYAISSAVTAYKAAYWGVRQGDLHDLRTYVYEGLDLPVIRDLNPAECTSPTGGYVPLQMRDAGACRLVVPRWPHAQEIAGFQVRAFCRQNPYVPSQAELRIEYRSVTKDPLSQNNDFRPLTLAPSMMLPTRTVTFKNGLSASSVLASKAAPGVCCAGSWDRTMLYPTATTLQALCSAVGYPIVGSVPTTASIPLISPAGNRGMRFNALTNSWEATIFAPIPWTSPLVGYTLWRHTAPAQPGNQTLTCSQPAVTCP